MAGSRGDQHSTCPYGSKCNWKDYFNVTNLVDYVFNTDWNFYSPDPRSILHDNICTFEETFQSKRLMLYWGCRAERLLHSGLLSNYRSMHLSNINFEPRMMFSLSFKARIVHSSRNIRRRVNDCKRAVNDSLCRRLSSDYFAQIEDKLMIRVTIADILNVFFDVTDSNTHSLSGNMDAEGRSDRVEDARSWLQHETVFVWPVHEPLELLPLNFTLEYVGKKIGGGTDSRQSVAHISQLPSLAECQQVPQALALNIQQEQPHHINSRHNNIPFSHEINSTNIHQQYYDMQRGDSIINHINPHSSSKAGTAELSAHHDDSNNDTFYIGKTCHSLTDAIALCDAITGVHVEVDDAIISYVLQPGKFTEFPIHSADVKPLLHSWELSISSGPNTSPREIPFMLSSGLQEETTQAMEGIRGTVSGGGAAAAVPAPSGAPVPVGAPDPVGVVVDGGGGATDGGRNLEISRNCALFGTSHAVVLGRIEIANVSFSHTSTATTTTITATGVDGSSKVAPENTVGQTILPRVFCGIYTMAENHHSRVQAVKSTWARKCTAFLAFSTADDPTIPAISLPHLGRERYQNMWQKVRSIWSYIYTHYYSDYDWFLLGGDDMYYIMENLYEFLSSPEIKAAAAAKQGVYLGRTLKYPYQPTSDGTTTPGDAARAGVGFNSGGAGYILDPMALRILAVNLQFPHCAMVEETPKEDVNVGACLKRSANQVLPYNSTRDAAGRQRFHPWSPGMHYHYRSSPNGTVETDWLAFYDSDLRYGLECCSTNSISFHYIDPDLMYLMHSFLYDCTDHEKRRTSNGTGIHTQHS